MHRSLVSLELPHHSQRPSASSLGLPPPSPSSPRVPSPLATQFVRPQIEPLRFGATAPFPSSVLEGQVKDLEDLARDLTSRVSSQATLIADHQDRIAALEAVFRPVTDGAGGSHKGADKAGGPQ